MRGVLCLTVDLALSPRKPPSLETVCCPHCCCRHPFLLHPSPYPLFLLLLLLLFSLTLIFQIKARQCSASVLLLGISIKLGALRGGSPPGPLSRWRNSVWSPVIFYSVLPWLHPVTVAPFLAILVVSSPSGLL